jgi:hypothetical protein
MSPTVGRGGGGVESIIFIYVRIYLLNAHGDCYLSSRLLEGVGETACYK